jgi:hypothetical protein
MIKVKNIELSMCVLKGQEMKTYGESGVIAPYGFNLDIRCYPEVRFKSRSL